MKERPLPQESFQEAEYPAYHSLWQGQEVSLNEIKKENAYKFSFVSRLLQSGFLEKVSENTDLVKIKPIETNRDIVNDQVDQLNKKARKNNLPIDGEPRI